MSTAGLIVATIGASAVWRGISPTLDGWTLLFVGSVLFGEQAARRIVAAVRHVEGTLRNRPVGRQSRPEQIKVWLGKTDAAHNKSASGTVSLWGGAIGSETDTGINVTAYNHFGNVLSGKKVLVWNNGHGWLLAAAEC